MMRGWFVSVAVAMATAWALLQSAPTARAYAPMKAFALTSSTTSTTITTARTRLGLFNNFLKNGKVALVKSLAGDFDEAAVKARLDRLIADNNVLMLSFTTCPFCIQAKACLDAKNAKYKVVELDQDVDGKAIRAVLGMTMGRTSVPAIWIQGQFIGGCNDGPMGGVIPLDREGKLTPLLKAAGAI